MKKTFITLLIIFTSALLATVIYKNQSVENPQDLLPFENKINGDFSQVEESIEKKVTAESIKISPIANEQNQKPFDVHLTNDITNVLLTEDKVKRVAELVRLADAYPKNELLQFLASANCIKLKTNPCDPKRFAERLLSINPKNVVGKELLISDSLNSKDYESALSILESIEGDESYNTYYSETFENVEYSLHKDARLNKYSKKKLEKTLGYKIKPDLSQLSDESIQRLGVAIDAIGIAAAQAINGDVTQACLKQGVANTQAERWRSACYKYGLALENSKTILGHSLGITIQARMQFLLGNQAAHEDLINIKNQIKDLNNLSGVIMTDESFFSSGEFEFYFSELKKYGEFEAMRRLIERQSTD